MVYTEDLYPLWKNMDQPYIQNHRALIPVPVPLFQLFLTARRYRKEAE